MASDEVIERVGWAVRLDGGWSDDGVLCHGARCYDSYIEASEDWEGWIEHGADPEMLEIHAAPEGYVERLLADRDEMAKAMTRMLSETSTRHWSESVNLIAQRDEARADRDRMRAALERLKNRVWNERIGAEELLAELNRALNPNEEGAS